VLRIHALVAETTERYVAEIARVLRQDGRFLSSWFLLDESRAAEGKAQFDFKFRFANHAQISVSARRRRSPTAWTKIIFAQTGLEITGIHHGGWSGAMDRIDSGQDILICRAAN
jgi:hypothetical protein